MGAGEFVAERLTIAVMPAKAGISLFITTVLSARSLLYDLEMPAYAGMTVLVLA
jgi:hypothetical protein